jgi:hypothetical protein
MTTLVRASGSNGSEGVAMADPLGAVERAMKVRDVIRQALGGKVTAFRADTANGDPGHQSGHHRR